MSFLDEDLGFWIKPRSTAWFSRFLIEEYDGKRWVRLFQMTKRSVLSLASLLRAGLEKKDTNYRSAIPALVRIACSLFKFCQGSSLLLCSELFTVGQSTVSIMLRDFVEEVNTVFRSEISWPMGDILSATAAGFYELCGLPGVSGAIDGTHFRIKKPRVSPAEYYYFKKGGYTIQCQAVVDNSKRFLDIHVGMLGSTNDSRVLRRSALFERAQRNALWDAERTFTGFSPYLLGDSGYPLLPWLMVPHARQAHTLVAEALFNRKLSRGRGIVENAFSLLKQSFKELHGKSELDITFLPKVVICCAQLHNVILNQSAEEVERLLGVLCNEGGPHASAVDVKGHEEVDDRGANMVLVPVAGKKRHGVVARNTSRFSFKTVFSGHRTGSAMGTTSTGRQRCSADLGRWFRTGDTTRFRQLALYRSRALKSPPS